MKKMQILRMLTVVTFLCGIIPLISAQTGNAPRITGPTSFTLPVGYPAASLGVFTIEGTAPVTVTKTSGDARITWNNTTRRLTVAAGLPPGVYPVTLTAVNGILPDATHTFTLTVNYSVNIVCTSGGSVSANKTSAFAGDTVKLAIKPNAGYELVSIWVYYGVRPLLIPVTLKCWGDSCLFVMPADHVTVMATFQDPVKEAWAAALKIIEAETFKITQEEANTDTNLRYFLADTINVLIKETGFVISPNDVVVYSFRPATAGDGKNARGINGSFGFRVSPPYMSNSAYNDGTITATPFDATANDASADLQSVRPLTAYSHNNKLYINGLTPGQSWQVYTLTGLLIHTGIAKNENAEIPLSEKGLYIITNGKKTLKITVK